MPTRKIILPSPNTVAASATSLISCPVGPAHRYRAIYLKIGVLSGGTAIAATALPAGGTPAQALVGDIRLKINGRTQRLHSAHQLNRLNALNGSIYAAAGWGTRAANNKNGQVITLWFAEPWRKTLGQQEALALPSSRISTLEVEVDFNALPTNGSSYNMVAWAEVDSEPGDAIHNGGVVLSKVFRQNLTGGTAAGSAYDLTTLDKRDLYTTIVADLGNTSAAGTAANGITASTSSGAGDYSAKLTITANSSPIAELTKDVAALIHTEWDMNPNQFDLEAILDSADDIRSGLTANGLSDLRVRIDTVADTCANGTWTLLTERTGPLD